MVDIKETAKNIYLIDDRLYSIPKLGSVYLINEEKKALIDTGPTTSVKTVLEGIRKAGIRPEDINYLIVTHIHLDHAGGAGVLIKEMPKAKLIVHHRGAKHMIDPTKLVNSVIATQGKKAMEREGEVVPIENSRVMPVDNGYILELSGGQSLKFIDAPGHAPHELCIYESRSGGLFLGDTAGMMVADKETLLPVTPPPSFDAELYGNTLERLKKLGATTLYFAHFGGSNEVGDLLQLAKDKVKTWGNIVAGTMSKSGYADTVRKLKARIYAELEPIRKSDETKYKFLLDTIVPLNIAGYMKYYQDRRITH